MSDSAIATAREALMAQLLEDVDAIVTRLESLDGEMAARIESAVADAVGRASLQARLDFVAMIGDQQQRLTAAGRHAAAVIGNQLAQEAVAARDTAAAVERAAARLAWRLGGVAFGSATLGGALVAAACRWL